MPVITKNQIRPRRIKAHFTNAEILLLDTASVIQIVAPAPVGQAINLDFFQVRTHIVGAYTNIDATNPNFQFGYDFGFSTFVEDIDGMGQTINLFTKLFATVGENLISAPAPELQTDGTHTFTECDPQAAAHFANVAAIAVSGGLFLFFTNGGSGNLTGGNVANFMDVFLAYSIVNL